MNSETFNLVVIICAIISLVIYYYIIKSAVASATEKQTKHADAQTRLLIEIARKQGVDEEKVEKIIKGLN